MRYVRERESEFIAWFVDPATVDESALRGALRTVPPTLDDWLEVFTPLDAALEDVKGEARLSTTSTWPIDYGSLRNPEVDKGTSELLSLKDRILREEHAKRISAG